MSTKKTKSKKPENKKPENSSDLGDVAGLFLVVNMAHRAGNSIPRGNAPTYLHQSLGSAHVEATRLAALQPGCTFAVFQCVGLVEAKIQAPDVRAVTDADIAGPEHAF